MRRLERALIDEHRSLVRSALAHLTPGTADAVAAVAALPDMIRGYEEIKLANVERYRAAAAEAMAALAAAGPGERGDDALTVRRAARVRAGGGRRAGERRGGGRHRRRRRAGGGERITEACSARGRTSPCSD